MDGWLFFPVDMSDECDVRGLKLNRVLLDLLAMPSIRWWWKSMWIMLSAVLWLCFCWLKKTLSFGRSTIRHAYQDDTDGNRLVLKTKHWRVGFPLQQVALTGFSFPSIRFRLMLMFNAGFVYYSLTFSYFNSSVVVVVVSGFWNFRVEFRIFWKERIH